MVLRIMTTSAVDYPIDSHGGGCRSMRISTHMTGGTANVGRALDPSRQAGGVARRACGGLVDGGQRPQRPRMR